MKLPLLKRLKKRQHTQIALLQDLVLETIYDLIDKPVLHGGTAIWRCYSGNRFSEDLDLYSELGHGFKKKFEKKLTSLGLQVDKFKNTGRVIFCKISDAQAQIRVEINLIQKKGIIKDYEKTDGSLMTVLTLTAEELIREKIKAYLGRRKIRDLYDIYHLLNYAQTEKIRKDIKEFIKEIKKPINEKTLRLLVFSGTVPSFKQMRDSIKRRV